jgi:hypothetical protein
LRFQIADAEENLETPFGFAQGRFRAQRRTAEDAENVKSFQAQRARRKALFTTEDTERQGSDGRFK